MDGERTDSSVDARGSRPELVTFGHGTADRAAVAGLLREAGVAALVDVRTAPGSRRDPDLARERLAEWLPEEGVDSVS
ncbi:DUF488 family protein, partial [Streptomyces durbertensis]